MDQIRQWQQQQRENDKLISEVDVLLNIFFNDELMLDCSYIDIPLVPGLHSTINSLIDACEGIEKHFERAIVSEHIKNTYSLMCTFITKACKNKSTPPKLFGRQVIFRTINPTFLRNHFL